VKPHQLLKKKKSSSKKETPRRKGRCNGNENVLGGAGGITISSVLGIWHQKKEMKAKNVLEKNLRQEKFVRRGEKRQATEYIPSRVELQKPYIQRSGEGTNAKKTQGGKVKAYGGERKGGKKEKPGTDGANALGRSSGEPWARRKSREKKSGDKEGVFQHIGEGKETKGHQGNPSSKNLRLSNDRQKKIVKEYVGRAGNGRKKGEEGNFYRG